ncbi:ATP-dependent DNA ligase [Aureimonas sp. SA4125]|uniref:DNA ligase D n=1 Tax=Aureimonas sp. SA4125 TaxID=2826993 RepID=UPI001CC79703|nr:DNA ligase D [Aureimonas sp. SA4125]BDA82907.1 ATP-dependent DNA ligase [Aureimonas sp. SA4125]
MASSADALLEKYRAKRDFATTAEPSGAETARKGEGLAFVVQKHDATRLHYDFRVEWEGVLKSWAVTRGPSLNPADKRLAVRTEDHPLDYGDFEGTIPAGEYGGGTVMLWDTGTWEPEGDAEAGFRDGNLKMHLHGTKMNGRWVLVRMKPRAKEKTENWLLIKEKDDAVDTEADLLKKDRSAKTDRSMDEIADGNVEWARKTVSPTAKGAKDAKTKKSPKALEAKASAPKAERPSPTEAGEKPAKAGASTKRAGSPPDFQALQLATLVDSVPAGAGWLHEMKHDGYRVLIALGGGEAVLYTRSALDWTERFGSVLPSVTALDCDSALIDGEIVAFDADGGTDFSTLQQKLKAGEDLSCFCFDLLMLDGEDLRDAPLIQRKKLLKALLDGHEDAVLLYSEHIEGNGPAMFKEVCAAGHEGIVSKRADAPYSGGRQKSWLKVKCTRRQEFVIGGFSPSDKAGRAFSSILVGVHEDGEFKYRGRVGSGFGDEALADLKARFDTLASRSSPFADLPRPIARTSKFVTPELVAEVDFAELTADGQIRHGVFKGLREDKPAEEIVDEKPVAAPAAKAGKGKASTANKPAPAGRAAPAPAEDTTAEAPPRRRVSRADRKDATVAGVKISHPERVVYEDGGVTKLALAEYYEAVAERMLVHAGSRPLSLVRCPDGPKKQCFFQKHDSGGFSAAIRKVAIAEKDGGTADYLYVDDAAGLVAAVQMNALEFHIWGAHSDDVEKPDRVVFDLDPDESLTFADVKRAALDMRDMLAELGLRTFPMITGGKGVHVVAPLDRRQDWPAVKTFARDVAERLAREEPKRFVATMSKAKRSGKIFIDWLRNERGATAIAPYSTRARDGAPVAVPVSWDELDGLEAANLFRLDEVVARLEKPDPWADYGAVRQSLTKTLLKKLAGT